jgi:hypothetical protein
LSFAELSLGINREVRAGIPGRAETAVTVVRVLLGDGFKRTRADDQVS